MDITNEIISELIRINYDIKDMQTAEEIREFLKNRIEALKTIQEN